MGRNSSCTLKRTLIWKRTPSPKEGSLVWLSRQNGWGKKRGTRNINRCLKVQRGTKSNLKITPRKQIIIKIGSRKNASIKKKIRKR